MTRKSGDGVPGCGMVEDFISRQRGGASHASVVQSMMGVWLGRDLASDKGASEAAQQAVLKQELRAAYASLGAAA